MNHLQIRTSPGAPRPPGSGPQTRTRREVLTAGWLGAAAISAVSCDLLSTEPSGSRNERVDTSLKEKEAPSLRRLVGAGELPPLEERLPENPMVVEPHEKPGPYGG